MTCDFDRKLVSAHATGGLDMARSLNVESHLAGCAECRVAWDEFHSAPVPVELPPSRATFADLATKLADDAPEQCAGFAESITALACGETEPEAELHLASCALCRDLADSMKLISERIKTIRVPVSQATFGEVQGQLAARPLERTLRIAAAFLLAWTLGWAMYRPAPPEPPKLTALQQFLDAPTRELPAGVTLDMVGAVIASESETRAKTAIRILDLLGAEGILTQAFGTRRALDPHISLALVRHETSLAFLADKIREGRTDILGPLIDEARPGSAGVVMMGLTRPEFSGRASAAMGRLPEREVQVALNLLAISPTPEEAAALVGLKVPGARDCALQAAAHSPAHRAACIKKAVASDLEFLVAAVGDISLRQDAEEALSRVPPDRILKACATGLKDPTLSLGAARIAARHPYPSLAAELLALALQEVPEEESLQTGPVIDDYDSEKTVSSIAALRQMDHETVLAAARANLLAARRPAEVFRRFIELRLEALGPLYVEYLARSWFREDAVRGVESLRFKAAIPELIRLYDEVDVRAALKAITGKSLATKAQWMAWWREQQ